MIHVRNILIVLALAALVVLIPGGGKGAAVATQAVGLGFLACIAWVASLMYRQNRLSLEMLGTARRTILYSALALATLTLSASSRLWRTPAGSIVWIVLIAAAAYAAISIIWAARRS